MSSELYRKSGGRLLSVSFCLLTSNFTSFCGEHYVLTTVSFSDFAICFLNLNDLVCTVRFLFLSFNYYDFSLNLCLRIFVYFLTI